MVSLCFSFLIAGQLEIRCMAHLLLGEACLSLVKRALLHQFGTVVPLVKPIAKEWCRIFCIYYHIIMHNVINARFYIMQYWGYILLHTFQCSPVCISFR